MDVNFNITEPYLHDAFEFFNLVPQLGLTHQAKEDLVAYQLCL